MISPDTKPLFQTKLLDSRCPKFNSLVTRSCSRLPRRRLLNDLWCVRRAEPEALNLYAYEVIELGVAVEAGAGSDEANPAGTQVYKDEGRS